MKYPTEYTVKVYSNGRQEWFLNGKLHREDGFAVIYPDGSGNWYLKGEELLGFEFRKLTGFDVENHRWRRYDK